MGSIPRTKRRPVSRRQRVKKYSFPVTTWVDGDLRRGVNVALSADGESRSKSLKARPEPRLPARVDTTAKVGEIFFRVCFYSGPAYKTRPRKSKKIFFGVGGHDQRGRCRRLLAPLPQRRAFVVLTVYEVRDLPAQVPDGAEARRLAPYCFDTTDKATGHNELRLARLARQKQLAAGSEEGR